MKLRLGVPAAALALVLVAAACGRDDSAAPSTTAAGSGTTAASAADKCSGTKLAATDLGVSADTITVSVLADVNSPLAPGLFKGNWDGVDSWAKYINANGGLACRQVKVNKLDSQLNPSMATNGDIAACKDSLAMVGNNALFNPTAGDLGKCPDSAGKPTGLPDIAALANDVNEECNSTTYIIQLVADTCPVKTGVRELHQFGGHYKWLLKQFPGLHGMYLVPGDLPTTLQSAVGVIEAGRQAGVKWDATTPVSGTVAQPGYDKFIQQMKTANSNLFYNGSRDDALIKMRKESIAQGLTDQVKVWGCSLACYTSNLLKAGGSAVEGTYFWLQFLPYSEADLSPDIKAYLDGVGGEANATSWGAQAFQAGQALKQVVDAIVAKDGPNAVTRAAVLDGLKNMGEFDSNGWAGKKDLRGVSPCFVMMQVKGGKFVRVYPEKPGTFDCDEGNVFTVNADPVEGAKSIK
jgi:ABC-type branched-subunit amino acid transport system substrate-binding protein